jgi:hypothetical protein
VWIETIGDGTAQDLTITFNLDSDNTFIWDESADLFVLSDTLQVESGTVNNGLQLVSTDSGAYASFQDNSTTDADQVLVGASGDDLVFATNGSFDMSLKSGGLEIDNGFGMGGSSAQAQQSHIADADGTLADLTTKFNTLLAGLEGFGFLASS